jgi:DNA (cytosine-5)-methyltransferase 1
MTFGSVCSGIECASAAWIPLGWRCAWTAEIEPFPSAVIQQRWGHKNYGDFTKIGTDAEPIDLLAGGTPCQDFSVAGLRAGMAGERGNLTLEFLRLADRLKPRWIVWENVPGVLSSNGGKDFGAFLGGLGQCGYGFAYRILDAQFAGVPQRRRRVFVVGHLGDWRRAAAVLFERESLQGHPPPSREKGQRVAATIAGGSGERGHDDPVNGTLIDTAYRMQAFGEYDDDGSASAMKSRDYKDATDLVVSHSLRADGFDASEDGSGRGTPLVTATLVSEGDAHSGFRDEQGLVTAFTLPSEHRGIGNAHNTNYIPNAMAVRRLTPRECERLQGLPDDYTLIKYRGKPAADGPRYKAIGNGWAIPDVRWIGQRIQMVEQVK